MFKYIVILFISMLSCSSCQKEYFNRGKRGKKRIIFGVPNLSTDEDSKRYEKTFRNRHPTQADTKYDTIDANICKFVYFFLKNYIT